MNRPIPTAAPKSDPLFKESHPCLTSAGCRLTIIVEMRALLLFKALVFLLMIMLCAFLPLGSDASEFHDIKVNNERTVSLQVVDVPLNEVLRILAKNVPMEIRGTVVSQERITVQFSNLTLEEALSRIMRGYNYVLVRPDESAKVLLVVMNKIDRTIQTEPASVAPAPGGPVAVPAGIPAGAPVQSRARPGIQPAPSGQAQEASSPVVGPAGTGQAGPQRPESQPSLPGSGPAAGSIPPLPGMPMGPGALPPGMAAGQAGPASVAGGIPPGISPPPGPTNPPPGGPVTSGLQPVPHPQPQQPAQQNPEPARVMTPFGERSVEPPGTGP